MLKKLKNNIIFKIGIKGALVVFVSSLAAIFYINTFIKCDKMVVSYKEKSSSDYKVKLKDNDYYNVKELPSGMGYIASLIDGVSVNFKYNFQTSERINYNLTYFIDAVVKVYDEDDKEKVLFEKTENIIDAEQIIQSNTNSYNLEKDIDIDYQHFNDLIKAFKSDYGLTNEAEVILTLNVMSVAKKDGFDSDIVTSGVAKVSLPLTERTINIKIDNKDINNTGDITQRLEVSTKNTFNLVLFVVSCVIDAILLFFITRNVLYIINNKSKYEKNLKKILRENDSIIANVIHNVDITNCQVIKISSFEELRDVHDNIGAPILFSEDPKRKVSCFTIVKDNLMYEYTLHDEDYVNVNDLGGENERTKEEQK